MIPSTSLLNRYPTQLALLLAITGVCFMASGAAMMVIGPLLFNVPLDQLANQMMQKEHANLARVLNTIVAFLSFGLPPLILAWMMGARPLRRLGFHSGMNARQLGWVILIALASIGLSGALAELNQQIPLSKAWHIKARALEESYQQTIMAMAYMPRLSDFLLALLTIAAAPAILEELMFRSGFQPILIGVTRSPFWGILLTAMLFSAIHFSIYGFLSRLALGILLGLVYYYGKNIWLPILFHFINNALIVVVLYWAGKNGKPPTEVMNEKVPLIWGLLSLIALFFLFRYFIAASRRYWNESPSLFHFKNELDD
ncbi:MAG: lysostaphin resistance A-like protein [Bacteroidota bacterium]|jgi:membrane protease YdiL (CAAX protease family)